METPFLVLLEQAELAAAEDRRVARAEADRRVRQAQVEAQAIQAAVPEVIAAAVAARTQQLRDAALLEVASVDQTIAAVERGDQADDASARARFARAVDQVVAAVLGENPEP